MAPSSILQTPSSIANLYVMTCRAGKVVLLGLHLSLQQTPPITMRPTAVMRANEYICNKSLQARV